MLSGATHEAHAAYLQAVLEDAQATGDDRISLIDVPFVMPEEGWGCDDHPSVATQERMAATLAEHLQSVLGW